MQHCIYTGKKWFLYGVLFLSIFYSCNDVKSNLKYFRYNQSSNITHLDPAFASDQANIWATTAIFNTLVTTDSSYNIQSSIAKKWNVSDDGLTYTFTLRNDVYFHTHQAFKNAKRKMIASDVVYSLQRLIDSTLHSPGNWILKDRLAWNNSLLAPNDTTFILVLRQPFQPMLSLLSNAFCSIVPHEVVKYYGKEFTRNPIGTGPFVFAQWRDNDVMILKKNTQYWEKDNKGIALPYIDGIRITFIASKQTEFLHLLNNKLDMLNGLDASFKNIVLTDTGTLKLEFQEQIQLVRKPQLIIEYLGINQKHNDKKEDSILLNSNFRKALHAALNKKVIIDYLRNGIGYPAFSGVVPPSLVGFNKNASNTYNSNNAKQYLALSNYKGQKITLQTNASYADMANYMLTEWKALGINVTMDIQTGATLKEMMKQGKCNFFRASWIADYPDPISFMDLFYSTYDAPPNYTRFANAKFDAYYEQALTEKNMDKRIKIIQAMDSIVLDELPIIPLFYDEIVRLTSKRVKQLPINGLNILDLKTVRLL